MRSGFAKATRKAIPLGDGWFKVCRNAAALRHLSPHPFSPYANFSTHIPCLQYRKAKPTVSPLFINRTAFHSSSSSRLRNMLNLKKKSSSTTTYPKPPILTFPYPSRLAGCLAPPPPLPTKPTAAGSRKTNPPKSAMLSHRSSSSNSFKPPSPNSLHKLLQTLPLPPDPTHPDRKGRCFDCLVVGHRPGACIGHIFCWNCRQSSHPAKSCPLTRPSARGVNGNLMPRGHHGEHLLPQNRPDKVLTLIHETPNLTDEFNLLNQRIIIDARFIPGHYLHSVNYNFLQALKWSREHYLASLSNNKYLLILPSSIHRKDFLAAQHHYLEKLGYVWYAWSPRTAASPLPLNFKIWLSLSNLPPYS